MVDYNKIHFDPTIFNKESYRQALETLENLQNSNAKLFLTTEDVYNEAADRGVTLHVAISAQADNSLSSKIRRFFTKEPAVSIPENAIEVQLDEKTIQYLKESIHNEDPLYLTQHLDDAMNSIYHVTDKDKVKYNNAKKEAYEDSRQHPEEVKDFLDTSDPRVQQELEQEFHAHDVFEPNVFQDILKARIENSKLDHEVQYYIPATEVKNGAATAAAANISFDSDNDFLNFISEQNIKMSEDGRLPEGAIEIKLDASLGLAPVFKPADLYDLMDMKERIREGKSFGEKLDHAPSCITFASEKDREEFQKVIAQALGRNKEPEKSPEKAAEQQPEVKSQAMGKSDGGFMQKLSKLDAWSQRQINETLQRIQHPVITNNNKINIDPMVFDEKSYRQALDILQKPDAKFYITAKDVVRGWTNPDQRKFTYANAADLISRWPTCVNVAIPDTPLNKIEQLFNPDLPASASAKIPDGAIEVKPGPSVIQGLKWSLDNKECLFHMDDCMWKDFSCADPKRLNDLEGLVKCVDHGLENYPNLAREVGDNKIPAFAFDQFNPVVADFRDFRHMDFTGPDADKRMFSSYHDEFRGKTHAEIHDQYGLSEKDLDSFAKNFCEYKLDAIKLDHAVKYYITQEKVNDFIDFIAEFYGKDKAQAQTATDVVKDWTFSSIQSTDEKGKIPEGAAEVCFKNESLKPEYSAVNIGDAVDLAWMISNKTIAPSEASFEYRPDAMTFASEKDWNKCQAMVEKALSKIKEHEPEQQKSHSNSNSLSR